MIFKERQSDKASPRIFGIMLVRDEGDVIEEVLSHCLEFCEHVWVGDTGSSDDTWKTVCKLAERYSNLTAAFSKPLIFHQGIRSLIFNQVRSHFRSGDWICKLDSDEFYAIDPKSFIRDNVRWHETALYLQWYYFRLADEDVVRWEAGEESVADRARSIRSRRRYYQLSEWSELRMFRYRPSMKWGPYCALPWNVGYPARSRIPVLHYPHRDPEQMQRRMAVRHLMRRRTRQEGIESGPGAHWNVEDWRTEVPSAKVGVDGEAGIEYDARGLAQDLEGRSGTAIMKGLSGPLRYWAPGSELPRVELANHLPKRLRRLALRALHPCLVRLLDRVRPAYPGQWEYPQLSDELQEMLANVGKGGGEDSAGASDPACV